jgi:uncharacterized membrane protein (DUF4010 family)
MEVYEPFMSLGLALAVGVLIGLQRQQAQVGSDASERLHVGGIRTYPLFALAGALAVLVGREVGLWLVGVGFAGVIGLVGLAYWDDLHRVGDRGLTSEFALIVTYLLGALAISEGVFEPAWHKLVVVAGVGITVTWLLSLKRPLHDAVAKLSQDDVYAALRFLTISVIVLPLLPNEAYGPFEAFNPFHVMLMVVLIAGLGFVGYVAMRFLGAGRGMGLTGFVGGLVSSTAVTLAFAGRARREPRVRTACALAVLLASTIMVIRVAVEVAVVNPGLLESVLIPLGAMVVVGFVISGALFLRARRDDDARAEEIEVTNPVEMKMAIQFGLLFAAVLFAAKAAQHYFGSGGLYLASILAGLTDMDAITLAVAKMAKEGLNDDVAVTAILLAAVSNTVVKGGMAAVLGGWAFGWRVIASFLLVLGAGGAGVAVLRGWF